MRIKKSTHLSYRDAEDLEWFAAELNGLGINANSMEPTGSPTYETPSFPPLFNSFSNRSSASLARSIWKRLIAASAFYAPTASVLMALHSREAVACDGKSGLTREETELCRADRTLRISRQLDVGRRLAVYPSTWSASEARLWRQTRAERIAVELMSRGLVAVSGSKQKRGPKAIEPFDAVADLLSLSGRRPFEVLAAIAYRKGRSTGAEAELWRTIDREAQVLIDAAVLSWNEAPHHRDKRARNRTDRLMVGSAA